MSHPAVITSYVQGVQIAAGRHVQACNTTDQWHDQWNTVTVCPNQWHFTR